MNIQTLVSQSRPHSVKTFNLVSKNERVVANIKFSFGVNGVSLDAEIETSAAKKVYATQNFRLNEIDEIAGAVSKIKSDVSFYAFLTSARPQGGDGTAVASVKYRAPAVDHRVSSAVNAITGSTTQTRPYGAKG